MHVVALKRTVDCIQLFRERLSYKSIKVNTTLSKVKCGNRELTLKCKLKCHEKPMEDPLGVSPSKGNQGTTRGKEKFLLTSVGIEPTTSI